VKTRRLDRFLTDALRITSADLLAYLERRVGRNDASDLLGETMVVAWRRITELPDDPEHARMWLFGIARTTLLNHARGEGRRWALSDRLRNQTPVRTAPAADQGIEVRDAIGRLDPDLAEIVRLVHWEQLSLVQVAKILDIPDSTVRGRYARAKEELRAALGVADRLE